MSNNVFANGREIACKSGSGKVIAAFPDVCFTPPDKVPPTPPGVPIPYPVTSMASDTNKGTKKVLISSKEAMKRDASNFKKCNGDNAAQTAKKGIISSKLTGKVYFTSWSMDVKIESKNVVRHLDTVTSNHSSPNANEAVPWPFVDSMAADKVDVCEKDQKKAQDACKDYAPVNPAGEDPCEVAGLGSTTRPNTHERASVNISARNQSDANDCINARRCALQPYKKTAKGQGGCCPSQTGNHVIPESYFHGVTGYVARDAPTMCVSGTSWHSGNHQYLHTGQSVVDNHYKASDGTISIKQAAKNGGQVQNEVFKDQGCSPDCIAAQVIQGHKDMGLDENTRTEVKTIAEGEKYQNRLEDVLDGNTIP